DRTEFVVPERDAEFTTRNVLAMSFVAGRSIESVAAAADAERDRVAALLIDLVLAELFAFGTMQTDPNFANFRYPADSGKIVLLDFGATRAVAPVTADAYRAMLAAGLSNDRDAVREAAVSAGFVGAEAASRHRALVDRMIDVILAAANGAERFDF